MATDDGNETTVSIPDEVYTRLETHRRDGETIADVIERLTRDEKDFYAGFGILSDSEIDRAVDEVKHEMDADIENSIDEMSGQ